VVAGRLDDVLVAMIGEAGSADLSLSFDSQASAVGIAGTIGAIGTACAVGIVNGIWRKPGSVPAVGVAGRIRIVRIGAQLAAVISLLVMKPRRIGGERIRRRLIAEYSGPRF